MKEKITIVTGFFNINRGNWKGFGRSDYQYLEYFKLWAKLKNKLIVYVESEELKNEILSFRESLGLKEYTIVNLVHNCLDVEPLMYKRMVETTENSIQKEFRLFQSNPEVWNGNYNYIMMMKAWCVCDAITNGQASGQIAWIDFGYNHGGASISADSDFNFEWYYDFPRKINLFALHEMDDRPIFEMVMSMDTYIMGCVIVAYDKLWYEFWNLLKKSVFTLCDCGLCDDDQIFCLMAYRMKPEIFNIIPSKKWSIMLYEFGGSHLKLVQSLDYKPQFKDFIRKFAYSVKFKLVCFRYALRLYKHMSKVNVK